MRILFYGIFMWIGGWLMQRWVCVCVCVFLLSVVSCVRDHRLIRECQDAQRGVCSGTAEHCGWKARLCWGWHGADGRHISWRSEQVHTSVCFHIECFVRHPCLQACRGAIMLLNKSLGTTKLKACLKGAVCNCFDCSKAYKNRCLQIFRKC